MSTPPALSAAIQKPSETQETPAIPTESILFGVPQTPLDIVTSLPNPSIATQDPTLTQEIDVGSPLGTSRELGVDQFEGRDTPLAGSVRTIPGTTTMIRARTDRRAKTDEDRLRCRDVPFAASKSRRSKDCERLLTLYFQAAKRRAVNLATTLAPETSQNRASISAYYYRSSDR